MKKKHIILLPYIFLLLLGSSSLLAQNKVGIVNPQIILNRMPDAKKWNRSFETLRNESGKS